MKIAILYYSRTGNTERVVNALKLKLVEKGLKADVYKILPTKEYSKPLHINPRLIYDTLIRRGVSVKFELSEPKLDEYDAVIVASPIWIGKLASPIQEFLRKHVVNKNMIVITTSIQSLSATKIESIVEKLSKVKPLLCVNIRAKIIKDDVKLRETVQDVVEKLTTILKSETFISANIST